MKHILAFLADYLFGHHTEESFSSCIDAENFQIFVVEDDGVRKLVKDCL